MIRHLLWTGLTAYTLLACGDDSASPDAGFVCEFPMEFAKGDDGHSAPLAAAAGEARAGRIDADALPAARGLAVWQADDFVLANDRFALLIEAAGPSELYDPWGGRPVGLSFVEGEAMVRPANFGEFFVLTEGETIVTESVSVINDGSDGTAAIIRAEGMLAPLPFISPVTGALLRGNYDDMRAAIDYVLEPGANYIDIFVTYHSPRRGITDVPTGFHGFMYTPRMRRWTQGVGFEPDTTVTELGFIDDIGPSYSYSSPGEPLESGLSVSGFAANFSEGFSIAECGSTRRLHARLTIGESAGVNGLVQSLALRSETRLREVTGVVSNSDLSPAAGVRVHALSESGDYLTRATTAADGSYSLHVPEAASVNLTTYRVGDNKQEVALLADNQANITLDPVGTIVVSTTDQDSGTALPVRIQVLPTGQALPNVPKHFGEEATTPQRLHVEFSMDGTASMRVPVGEWEVVVSRGYEYELFSEVVTVSDGVVTDVSAVLEHVVDTDNQMCADFHIHTNRSADSGDASLRKVRSAVADGLELPVRSEHEYAADFQQEIADLDVQDWAYGMPSVELTTLQFAGHFGVLPVTPNRRARNAGAPQWQRYPGIEDPDQVVESLQPPEIFAAVRARPESPVIVINHPRGGTNYFDYAGFDPITGMVRVPEVWDEEFTLVEVFNDSGWLSNLSGTVADWLSLLSLGRRVFAVGSSDSHGVSRSPVGYPRTCLELGTNDPRVLTNNMIRDATAKGASTIVGGVYVTTSIGGIGPGGEASGLGASAQLRVQIQAASWVDVDLIDIVVDGVTTTITIDPLDADPMNPALRFDQEITIDVSTNPTAYVLVAAYGDQALEPVHRKRIPFGVSNPIFLSR